MSLTAATTSSSARLFFFRRSLLLLRPPRRPLRRDDFKPRASSCFSIARCERRKRSREETTTPSSSRRDVKTNVVSRFFFGFPTSATNDVALFSLLAASRVLSGKSEKTSSAVLFASLVFLPARVARWCCGKQGIPLFFSLVFCVTNSLVYETQLLRSSRRWCWRTFLRCIAWNRSHPAGC